MRFPRSSPDILTFKVACSQDGPPTPQGLTCRSASGLQAVGASRCTGGRPPALRAKDLAVVKALLKDPEITVAKVARRLGVAASTLYRHLPRARTAAAALDA